jgi:tetratricopeptide (TPR) repeat protein
VSDPLNPDSRDSLEDLAQRGRQALDRLAGVADLPALQALIEADPERLDERFEAGFLALQEGRMDDALDVFADLASAAPGHPPFQFGFALCLQHFGDIEGAGRHFSAAYALDPSDAAAAFRVGECLAALGHRDDAREALLAAQTLARQADADPVILELSTRLLDTFN